MKPRIRTHFVLELTKAREAAAIGDFNVAWVALQRAHILGQAFGGLHVRAHWEMLKIAWRQRDIREIVGQVIRTALAGPASLLLGGVRALRPGRVNAAERGGMSIPDDLRDILDSQ